MTEREKMEVIKKLKRERLKSEVEMLWASSTDSGVQKFFDRDSYEMLEKKREVLNALNDGKEVSDKDYYLILEKMPKDKNGEPAIEIWW